MPMVLLFYGSGYALEGTEYQIKGAMMVNFFKIYQLAGRRDGEK